MCSDSQALQQFGERKSQRAAQVSYDNSVKCFLNPDLDLVCVCLLVYTNVHTTYIMFSADMPHMSNCMHRVTQCDLCMCVCDALYVLWPSWLICTHITALTVCVPSLTSAVTTVPTWHCPVHLGNTSHGSSTTNTTSSLQNILEAGPSLLSLSYLTHIQQELLPFETSL